MNSNIVLSISQVGERKNSILHEKILEKYVVNDTIRKIFENVKDFSFLIAKQHGFMYNKHYYIGIRREDSNETGIRCKQY